MSFLKDIFHQKTAKEQEAEIKMMEQETQRLNKESKVRERRLETQKFLREARQRLSRDKSKERESSALRQTLRSIKDFVVVPPTKPQTKARKTVKSKKKAPKRKSGKGGKGFIEGILPF